MTALNGQGSIAAAPRSQHGTWHHNDYTTLRDTLIGTAGDAQDDTGLFPSGWTPETDDTNKKG